MSLVQAEADRSNGDYDLMALDLLFAAGGFLGAKNCFDNVYTISTASNTAKSSTNTSTGNTNTVENPNEFTFKGSGRKIDISRWSPDENGAWGNKNGKAEGLAIKAPEQVEPGIRYLEGQYIRDIRRVEPWRAYYDEYGRLIARNDYNAPDPSAGITATHHHLIEWTRGGKTGEPIHYEGEYEP